MFTTKSYSFIVYDNGTMRKLPSYKLTNKDALEEIMVWQDELPDYQQYYDE